MHCFASRGICDDLFCWFRAIKVKVRSRNKSYSLLMERQTGNTRDEEHRGNLDNQQVSRWVITRTVRRRKNTRNKKTCETRHCSHVKQKNCKISTSWQQQGIDKQGRCQNSKVVFSKKAHREEYSRGCSPPVLMNTAHAFDLIWCSDWAWWDFFTTDCFGVCHRVILSLIFELYIDP